MFKGSRAACFCGVDMIADRTALHEDDRVVAVAARYVARQSGTNFALILAGPPARAVGREMMAFIDNQVAIAGDAIVYNATRTML